MSEPRTAPSALSLLTKAEKGALLDDLVMSDDDLRDRAEAAARRMLAEVEIDEVADAVAIAVLALSHEELATRAGKTRYGYIEPTEAAWSLLEQTIEPWINDLIRRADLGLGDSTRQLATGVLKGLRRLLDRTGDDGLVLSWAPDFPDEAAEHLRVVLADLGVELPDRENA
jgi:hypothetical protein